MAAPLPRLIAITDLEVVEPSELLRRIETLAQNALPGSLAILLRDHQASARRRLAFGRQLSLIARRTEQQLWVADRLDLALLLQADGAHLGEASVTASAARRLLGPDRHLSRAWHGADAAALPQQLDELNALLVSPIFAPRKGRPALGVAALASTREILRALGSDVALYALGGVTAAEVPACDAAGAAGVAAIGAALLGEPGPLLDALRIRR